MVDSSVRKAFAVAVVAAVTTLSGGCGSGDDDDPGEGASAATTAQQSQGNAAASYPVGGNEEETVRKLVEDVYAGTAAADPDVCGSLTKAAQQQLVAQGTKFGFKPLPCPKMVEALFGPVKSVNSKRDPEIVSAKVNGSTAIVKLKRRKIPPLPYTAVKVDGEWKLADFGKDPVKAPPGAGN